MASERSLWQTVRWPLAVLLVAAVGIGAATILEEVYSSEWSLTVGAPSIWVLFVGGLWLVVAIVVYLVRHRRAE